MTGERGWGGGCKRAELGHDGPIEAPGEGMDVILAGTAGRSWGGTTLGVGTFPESQAPFEIVYTDLFLY